MNDNKDMSINSFVEELVNRLNSSLTEVGKENITVSAHEVCKNNGVTLHGLIFRDSSQEMAPTIYVEGFYDRFINGAEINDCISEIMDIFSKSMDSIVSYPIDFILDYEQTVDHIFPKLINAEKNRKLINGAPHAIYGDLAVIFQIRLENMLDAGAGVGTVVINNEMAKSWGKGAHELLDAALKNMHESGEICIRNILSVLCELIPRSSNNDIDAEALMGSLKDDPSPKMYVMTNKVRANGAVSLVDSDKLSEFADSIGSDLYIIPSSVHELILVPQVSGEYNAEDLAVMVKEVNMTQVPVEDYLSDNIYIFTRGSKAVCNALTGEVLELKVA